MPTPPTPPRPTRVSPLGELSTDVLDDVAELEALRADWDALAVAASRPYSAPGWALPWWDRARPPGSRLRVVTVRRGPDLVGLAPCFLGRDGHGITTCRLMGDSAASYVEPLTAGEPAPEVASAIAVALAGSGCDVVSLGGIPRRSPWPALLRTTWPGRRPHVAPVRTMGAPYVDLPAGGPEEWLEGRSSNFRQQVRRRRREFLRRGGRLQVSGTRGEALTGLHELVRLHHGRWSTRGGSQALRGPMAGVLERSAAQSDPARFQLWTATAEGRTVAAALFMAAGREMHYWLGGFDEDWAPVSPSLLLLVEAVVQAPRFGCRRISLGPGAQPYKQRMGTGEDELVWVDLLPRTGRYPYVRLSQAPYRLRRVAADRTPPQVKQRVRRGVARLGPPRRPDRAPDADGAPAAVPTEQQRGDRA